MNILKYALYKQAGISVILRDIFQGKPVKGLLGTILQRFKRGENTAQSISRATKKVHIPGFKPGLGASILGGTAVGLPAALNMTGRAEASPLQWTTMSTPNIGRSAYDSTVPSTPKVVRDAQDNYNKLLERYKPQQIQYFDPISRENI